MRTALIVGLLLSAGSAFAQEPAAENRATANHTPVNLEQLSTRKLAPGLMRSALGVTRKDTPIPCWITANDLNYSTPKTRVLLVGGLDGQDASVQAVVAAIEWFQESPAAATWRNQVALSAAPCANPDGWARQQPENQSGGNPTRGYPPRGLAYDSPTDPEAAYLWRWIGMHAPDLVVDVRGGASDGWVLPPGNLPATYAQLQAALPSTTTSAVLDELISQLPFMAPSGTGTVPAIKANVSQAALTKSGGQAFLPTLLAAMERARFGGPSPARRELQMRVARSPVEVATQLGKHYGHELNQVQYIPAVALIGRLRLGLQTGDAAPLVDVERIVAPYLNGQKRALPDRPSGSDLSGHLVFGELAKSTKNAGYVALIKAAADLGFDEQGKMKAAMPFHSEMSDAVFMGCPILAQVGQLTGDTKYYDMCLRHMRFMLKLNLRPDGLHQHSPLDRTAWGRGNGFPALGLALCLSEFPRENAGREEMLTAFRAHLEALAPHQDPTGAWHQVIDFSGSYRELTCTAMITYAMIRGVREGWLSEAEYGPRIERGWRAVQARVAADGTLVDVCAGTGKQKSLRDYLDRPAILGKDPRGGAMALLVATEMAAWRR